MKNNTRLHLILQVPKELIALISLFVLARLLYTAENQFGDISDSIICDLGVGCGVLSIASWIMGASYVFGLDIDDDAIAQASENFLEFDINQDLVKFEETLDYFKVSPNKGLSSKQLADNHSKYGKNELPEEPTSPLWRLILEQFQDQLVIILLIAAAISLGLAALENQEEGSVSAFVEPAVILLILIANATVGVIQETNAETAINALKELSADEAKVLRDGVLEVIHARDIVPGDIIHLTVGNKIPADCRLVEIFSSSFKVDQSILTGEAESVTKEYDVVVSDKRAVKQDQINILFSGTTITIGKAVAVVVAIGEQTALGEIHSSISEQSDDKTPLKIKLDEFGDQLAKIITVICVLVWLINIRHFNDESFGGNWLKGSVYYFKIAVALAVAAIPEGLSAVITTCLALGTRRMAAQGAIVRKLRSVETLGCTSVICSDKTGTLTTNQMSVRKVFTFEDSNGQATELNVEGSTYGPEGQVFYASTRKVVENDLLIKNKVLNELSLNCILCNDSKVQYDAKTDTFVKIGEPTEAALKTLAEKLGTDNATFNASNTQYKTIEEVDKLSVSQKAQKSAKVSNYVEAMYHKVNYFEFTRDRKSMSVLVERIGENESVKTRSQSQKQKTLFVKGAPEAVVERCSYVNCSNDPSKAIPFTKTLKEQVLNKMRQWAETDALRILAFAKVENPVAPARVNPSDYVKIEVGSNMTFLGLVGMLDPPREEVLNSIKLCRTAGIRVIVITGDNKKTAESICKQIGIFEENENLEGRSYTGREFDEMSLEQKISAVRKADLFSRTEPSHKQELIDLLQGEGWICAMTGDGVNDAPALKKADIGIAMGSGTDVAKLASDMVLADDNFATIVAAVEEGRSIYANTKQFIRYLISSNIGEVVSIFLTVLLGMPEALIPVQLLWVNLVTDGLPATALGFNPADNDIMRKPPRHSGEAIVTPWLFVRYMVVGTFVGCATIFGYAWWFMFYQNGPMISWYQLSNFHQCSKLFPEIGCEMFNNHMSQKATTMSLSILVVVEMFNAMN
ncbi:hypothetical protein HK099_008251, partial [Clydaea vesicula]